MVSILASVSRIRKLVLVSFLSTLPAVTSNLSAYTLAVNVDLTTAVTGGTPVELVPVTVGPFSFDIRITALGGGNIFVNPTGIPGIGNTAGNSLIMDRSGDALQFEIVNFTGSNTGPPILLLTGFGTNDMDGPSVANHDGFDITGDFTYGVRYDYGNAPTDTADNTFTPGTTPAGFINTGGAFPATTIEAATGAMLGSAGNPNGGGFTVASTSVGGQIWAFRRLNFAIVPEPSRALLLLGGVTACLLRRRR